MPGIPSQPNNIPLASSLPKVSFRKIPPEEAFHLNAPAGVLDPHVVAFGYNDGSAFEKPDHYIRYVEPIESDLKRQVEYDMDEQDQEWLEVYNAERRKDGLDLISPELFEIILDQLEKEWFDLMKRVPPKVRPGSGATGAGQDDDDADSEGDEDSKCAICDDGECENSNAIVFCDGCNLAVHQDCYGIPYIPEGQWLCRKCTVSPDRAVSCILCPHEGGAFKQTTTGKWAHLLCAMWIPETGVSNPVYMEPIDSIERIPKARWRLQCYLCRYKMGACIQCDRGSCFTAFHVTCARKAGLLFRTERTRVSQHLYEDSDDSDDEGSEQLRACCHKHIPKDMRDQLKINFGRAGAAIDDEHSEGSMRGSPAIYSRTREQSIESGFGAPLISVSRRSSVLGERDQDNIAGNKRISKSARAYKKSFKAGPPLVPAYIADRVLEYISKTSLRKKTAVVQLVARYWSLKREARRGAPLLKRLHLEPWTASPQNKEQTDAQKGKKLLFLREIREDLERVRMLVEQVRKREKEKLRQAQQVRTSLVEELLFPYHQDMRAALARFEASDKYGFFSVPVSRVDVPDYYDIIKEPMDWAAIRDNINEKRYDTITQMRADVLKVASNAMTYNKVDTPYHKAATKILKLIPEVFDSLEKVEPAHLVHHLEQLQKKQAQDSTRSTPAPETQAQQDTASTQSKVLASRSDNVGATAQVRQQLLDLALEPPSMLVDLLRDYDLQDPSELEELRADAYHHFGPPPTKRLKLEEEREAHHEQDGDEEKPKYAASTDIVPNLMEDFVQQIYVPPPPPEMKKMIKKVSPAASAADTPAPAKQPKKRKVSATAEAPQPAERRSTRRTQADTAEAKGANDVEKADEKDVAESAALPTSPVQGGSQKRKRTGSDASAASAATVVRVEAGTEDSTADTSAEGNVSVPASIHVKEQVGDHDSFLLFNTGWVLPEGAKRHRNTTLRPEFVGKRPRKVSAPESPSTQAAELPAGASTGSPSRPRSKTVPSQPRSSNDEKAVASKSAKHLSVKQSTSVDAKPKGRLTRTSARSEAQSGGSSTSNSNKGGSGTGSSPLTSDDEREEKKDPNRSGQDEHGDTRADKPSARPLRGLRGASTASATEDHDTKAESVSPLSIRRSLRQRESTAEETEGASGEGLRPSLTTRQLRGRSHTAEPSDADGEGTRATRRAKTKSKSTGKSREAGKRSNGARKGGGRADSGGKDEDGEEEDEFGDGTMVWAKMDGYPYFPAAVIEDPDDFPPGAVEGKPDHPPMISRTSISSSHSNSASKQLQLPAPVEDGEGAGMVATRRQRRATPADRTQSQSRSPQPQTLLGTGTGTSTSTSTGTSTGSALESASTLSNLTAEEESKLRWVLVRFFDRSRTWTWLPSNKLAMMFENEDVDQKMLKAPQGRNTKGSTKKDIREAYELARQELDA
ncbi:hypothetical protein BCV70DRAFT_42705 [Testicularia cyperi]|uniref:Uncharacterized protein n=1 Tax=Testicularia cyperi TaxID=1882483 RepID=A0A317XHZ5_9BASI|nr:hypothetical protein BCV70DRAFT_42705 [Testicularia cyperi]